MQIEDLSLESCILTNLLLKPSLLFHLKFDNLRLTIKNMLLSNVSLD